MYRMKSTEWEETLKTKVKLAHLNKKIHLNNRQIVQTKISHSTLKVFLKKSRLKPNQFYAHFTVSVWPQLPL